MIVHRFFLTSIFLLMLAGCEAGMVRGYESSDGTKVKFNPAKLCKPTDLVTSRAGHGIHGHRIYNCSEVFERNNVNVKD